MNGAAKNYSDIGMCIQKAGMYFQLSFLDEIVRIKELNVAP